MIRWLLVALVLLAPAQGAPIRITVYTEPNQPADTTDVVLWLVPGVPAQITTQPPLTALPPVQGGACALTGAVLACTPESGALILRLPLPLARVAVTQGASSGEWPARAAPVWPETTVRIGDSPHAGYRRLTIDTTGAGGIGYIVIPQDGGTAAMDAYAHGSDTSVCKRLIWYDTFTRDVQSVWVACGVYGSGQVVIDLPHAITYVDLIEEVGGVQQMTRWLMDSGAPARQLALPLVTT